MRILLAAIIVLNLACIVWLKVLPKGSDISETVLSQKSQTDVASLSLQVDVGRQYMMMFKKHKLASVIVSCLLLANCCVCFISLILLTGSAQTNKGQNKATSSRSWLHEG